MSPARVFLAVAAVLLAGLPIASTTSLRRKISPELLPPSDKAFFGKDYPHDNQPKPTHTFSHPHPVVQETDAYDSDFPKDENSDNGEWKAQFTYDTLRSKIASAKKNEEMRKRKTKEAEDAWKAAQAEEAAAAANAKEAREAADAQRNKEKMTEEEAEQAAKKAKAEADAKAGDAKDGSKASESDGNEDVEGAMKKVEGEMNELEDCKKKLKEAQEKLKSEMEGSESRAQDLEAKATEEAEAKETAAEKAQAMEEAKKKAEEQSAVHKKAKEEYDATASELNDMEDQLKKAEEKLRKYRHKQVDAGGGVYQKEEHDPCANCPKTGKETSMTVQKKETSSPPGADVRSGSASILPSAALLSLLVFSIA